MKTTKSLIVVKSALAGVLVSVFLLMAPGARAVDYFSAGTNYLAVSNLSSAYGSFASAVAANPGDAEANVYYAMTRVLMLPSLPAGSGFLTALGFSKTGRNVYDWTAAPRKSSNHKLIVPSGVNADQFPGQLRTNVLLALVAAQTNLAQITDRGFTLELPQDVTHLPDVTMDYGDVLMLRAMLNGAEMFIYGLNSLNFNASLVGVSNIIANDKSIEAVLTNYPAMLTFATTSDKGLAAAAFTNAASLYFAASDFIRNVRAPGQTYLFNLGTNDEQDELEFRETLSNLVLSVNGPAQPLPMATNIFISMGALFSETNSPRLWLPEFAGSAFVWDSWPDVTLGGVVMGLTETNLDRSFRKIGPEARLDTSGLTLTTIGSLPESGNNPNGVILGQDGNLYGTLQFGGGNYEGSIFKMTPSGKVTTLYEFGSGADQNGHTPNGLIQGGDGYLYGTTQFGGTNNDSGTIFRISPSGGSKTFKVLYDFGSQQDGYASQPSAALLQGSDGYLYGTAYNPNGMVFRYSPTSGFFSNLYTFSGQDGENPASPLIEWTNSHIYGVTSFGGSNNSGTIFKINMTNGNFASVYSFGAERDGYGYQPTGLMRSTNGGFYGTTQYGGTNDTDDGGDGVLYKMSTTNQANPLTVLYCFDQQDEDGFYPIGSIVESSDGRLFGVASGGGANGRGSIFAFTPHSAVQAVEWFMQKTGDYANLNYNGYNNYEMPGLIAGWDGNFYGTTTDGGDNGNGAVYKLAMSPEITTNPVTQAVTNGGVVTLQVAATGSGALKYQWYFNGSKLANGSHVSGATNATLVLSGVTAANSGSYNVVVSNSSSSTTSDNASVSVLSINTPPASQTKTPGGIVNFSVNATGMILSYQWLFNGSPLSDDWNISGSKSSQLAVGPIMSTNFGSYSVIVTNSIRNSSAAMTSAVAVLKASVETTKPSVTIVSPKAGSRTGAPVLSGTALDSVWVTGVWYWITNVNPGVVAPPIHGMAALSAGNATSNWIVNAALRPGTNILVVQSSNYAGLVSFAASVTFFYQAGTLLVLQTNPAGMGTLTGSASVKGDPAPPGQATLNVGEGYTLTAKPANNWWLTNWMVNGNIAGTNATLSFIMESNLTVTANFATNQFIGMAGRYDGIFYPSEPPPATVTNSGLVENLQLKTNGVYSGKLYLAGKQYTLAGGFNRSGNATNKISRSAAAGGNATVGMSIQWQSQPRQITGWVQGGDWIATNFNLYAATTNLNNAANYTVLLPQDTNAEGAPPSYGYVLVTNTGSMINMGGALSDGTLFSRSEPINEQNQFPVYAGLYKNAGLLLGELSLTNAGEVIWFKPPMPKVLYSNGFNAALEALISPWTNSASALANFTNIAMLTFSGGGLASTNNVIVRLTSSNTLMRISGTNFHSGSINPKNGLMSVTFTNASGKKATANGTVLQNTNLGGGFFNGATNSGTITLRPAS